MSAAHAARLGARLRFRARLNNFDAIGQMVSAGIGVAVMPEVAAKRCARSMKINVVRIRDSWANRRLVICARSFKSLPRPAQQLVEHLRKIGVALKTRRIEWTRATYFVVPMPASFITFAHFLVSAPM